MSAECQDCSYLAMCVSSKHSASLIPLPTFAGGPAYINSPEPWQVVLSNLIRLKNLKASSVKVILKKS